MIPAPYHGNNVAVTLGSKQSCGDAPVRAYGLCPRPWAEAPIQNRRPHRCGNGPESVSFHHPSQATTAEGEHGPC